MFKKILVVCRGNIYREGSKFLNKLKYFLNGKKFRVVAASSLKKNDFKDVDLVITLGGDGTFLKTASFVRDSFIIGINSNPRASEGALTSISVENIYFIKEIIEGKFRVVERPRAKVTKNNVLLDKLALNEVYIGSKNQFHTSRYILYLNGRKEEHRSSGVLVSTGTGSTAWYSSAGGKPFHPNEKKLKFIVREPFSGRLFKPLFLQGEIPQGHRIKIESTGKMGTIVFDSNNSYNFDGGDVAEVELSDKPLRVIVPAGDRLKYTK